jgi:hypothetical protein
MKSTTVNMNTVVHTGAIVHGYDLPYLLFLPQQKGIRNPRLNTIEFLNAPTPPVGNGDPRVMGSRVSYQNNTTTIWD